MAPPPPPPDLGLKDKSRLREGDEDFDGRDGTREGEGIERFGRDEVRFGVVDVGREVD